MGGLPYVLREVEVGQVIGTRLTLALVKSKLDEHRLAASTVLTEAAPGGEPMQIGPFRLDFVRMAHSIPDSTAVVIETSAACSTPATGSSTTRRWTVSRPTWARSRSLGNRGVDLLLGDSTNAERPGMTGWSGSSARRSAS